MHLAGGTIGAVDHLDELWSPEPADSVVRALRARDVTVHHVLTASEVQRSPSFLALSWTFGYLEALGVAAGLVVLTGMVLYLSARQRERSLSYAMARRMGLRRGSHRLANAVEILTILLAALVVGVLAGSVAAVLVNTRLDPLRTVPPEPLTRLPLGALGVVVVGIAVAGLVAAWLVQRAAERARVADLMRLPV
jgi:putative ABC transport system permease protein